MDSVYALVLCGDIEDMYGVSVDPTLAWDYPTVAAITQFLSGQLAAPRAGGS
jgi:acyl carrier protein